MDNTARKISLKSDLHRESTTIPRSADDGTGIPIAATEAGVAHAAFESLPDGATRCREYGDAGKRRPFQTLNSTRSRRNSMTDFGTTMFR